MASNVPEKHRGIFSSFWHQEVIEPIGKIYLWLKNQAVGYLGLAEGLGSNNLKEKLMSARRVDIQPDPRMTQEQWEAQQGLIEASRIPARSITRREFLWYMLGVSLATATGTAVVAASGILSGKGDEGSSTGGQSVMPGKTSTPAETATPSNTATSSATATETGTATEIATAEATASPTPEATATPTATATERPLLKPEWFTPPELETITRIPDVNGQPVRFGLLNPDEVPNYPNWRTVYSYERNGVKYLVLSGILVAGPDGKYYFEEEGMTFLRIAFPVYEKDKIVEWKVAYPAVFLDRPPVLFIQDTKAPHRIQVDKASVLEQKIVPGTQVIILPFAEDDPYGTAQTLAYRRTVKNAWLTQPGITEGRVTDVVSLNFP